MRFDRVTVTGGSGRLGRHVLDLLADRCALTVIDQRTPDAPVPFTPLDVTDYAGLVQAFKGQEAVIHLAAIPNPRTAPPEVTFHVNVQGTFAVLQAAEDAGVRRVLVASSDSAVGLHYNPPDWVPQYLPIDEQHPMRPIDFYGLSKQVTETICQSYAHRGRFDVVVIRPTHIVFAQEYPELGTRGSDPLNYHLWNYVAPEDVARGFALALDLPEIGFELFFVSAADGLNTRPTLEMVRERYGFVPTIKKPELYERRPTASVIDIDHAREGLGFEPTIDWRRMLATG